MRRWSPLRVATAAVLGAWAGLFWFLLTAGRTNLYLSSRTAWVVPMGAVVLTAAALGRLLTARASRPEPLHPRTAWGLALVLLPALLVFILPPAALGSFAASRRTVSGGFASGTPDLASGPITLGDVARAQWSENGMNQLVERAGTNVRFTGIVTRRDGMPADEFLLTRFIVSCCVADALSVQVRVVGAPPGKFEQDEWVEVSGALFPLGSQVVVDASEVEGVPRPKRPYLTV